MINKVNLANFRNFRSKIFKFSPDINVIVGPNASGKTNILESIFVLSTGKSFRARIEEEMINYNHELARVGGSIVGQEEGKPVGTNLEVVLTRGEITLGANPEKTSKVAKKKLLINGVSKRLVDFAGNLRTVLFGPWDLELVTEEPSKRRKFLDTVLSQVDKEYRRASLSYEKGLRQRNRLLWRIREEGVSRSQLLFWNKLLVKNGDYISQRRREFIEFANADNFSSKGRPAFGGQFSSTELSKLSNFQLDYDPSAISETRLEQYANEEVAAASTLVGPHRDDFIFKIKKPKRKNKNIKRDLAKFGSRGEQRMGVLWLKLAELAFIEKKTGDKPVLLLDDIFSELDHEHREIVFEVSKGQQTIITTADPHFVGRFKVDLLIKLRF
jgi:DNA replication and repair protein RecF